MSQVAGSVVVAIKAVDEVSSVFGKIQASLGVLGGTLSQLGGGFSSLGSVVSGFAAGGVAGAAVAGIGQLVQGLQWATSEAAESQQAWTNLQASLKLTGPAWDDARAALDTFASSLQKTTTFSDEMVLGAVQRMSTFGMSYTQAMDAVKVAVDLAAAKHIDLQTASDLVGKAFMGNTAILQRYGIDLTTSKEATAAMKDAVDSVASAMQGQPEIFKAWADAFAEAGVSIDPATAKTKDFKDAALQLIGAFQQGNVDAEIFDNLMGELGATIDTTKLKTSDFPAVMAQLNAQFGGEAAAQAETYAGAQERLKNAMSDMGEKIGGILLPALAGITERMIPVVDWFTQGIGKVQVWITEVGKMPEVKAAVDAAGEAFAGLQKWFGDVAQIAMETLGPALQELMGAFSEIWDALKPLGEAFGEILAAFNEGEGSGNILKDILGLIADNIKLVATGIKTVAPFIKMLAEAFKDAAEFITPFLVMIRDAVGGFLSWLHDAFQNFYNFLIGHSLWQDLWNGMVQVVQSIGGTISAFIQGLFATWQAIFQGGMMLIGTILTTGFGIALATVQTIVQGATDILKQLIGGVQSVIQGTTKDWGDLVANVTTNVGIIRDQIQNLWDWAVPFWQNKTSDIAAFMAAKMNEIVAKVSAGSSQMQSTWSSALGAMESTTRSSLQRIYDEMNRQVDAIIRRLQDAKNQISAHSIWPDMLSEMVGQTRDAMSAINAEFSRGFESPAGIIPTIESATPAARGFMSEGPGAGAMFGSQQIDIPINVYLDGELVTRLVERRFVDTITREATRSRRD